MKAVWQARGSQRVSAQGRSGVRASKALRTRNWQDDSGVTRYVTEIVVGQNGTMQMLGGRRDGGQPEHRSAATRNKRRALPLRHNLLAPEKIP
ncbi:hypothetical protein KCP76_26310 (plasmid) [Salmonella enterica subsp. enterica serovar Weltevreden]|nr:hypothetical protein KCP76_26310 [Salmonella enterica subsp. enterica serovar Weltevreden]QUI99488.1 hypothetical protein KCP74_25730 [Salmonella enterica subsp. enterica]QUJ01257.1 hypothetical protein KCP73_27055 [Salmonella enterica subsp. enterica]